MQRVRKSFPARAKSEAHQRSLTEKMADIFSDMTTQMKQFSVMDLENDKSLLKLINDSKPIREKRAEPFACGMGDHRRADPSKMTMSGKIRV
jgi:hypothetical protein